MSCLTYKRVISLHMYEMQWFCRSAQPSRSSVLQRCIMRHATYMNESCHTHERVMLHVIMSHIDMWHDTKAKSAHTDYGSCLTYKWVVPYLYMSHVIWAKDVFIRQLSRICFCPLLLWVMSHMNESCHKYASHVTYEYVTSYIHMSHVTSYVWHESCHFICVTWDAFIA